MLKKIAAATVAGMVGMLALSVAAVPVQAKGLKGPMAPLKGSHMGVLKGVGPQGNVMIQFKLDVSRGLDGSARGTHQWRTCRGIERLCKRNVTLGGGWSKASPVSIGLMGGGMFVGQSREGMLFMNPAPMRGLQTTFLPSSGVTMRSGARNWSPGTFFGIINCLAHC